MEQLKTKCLFRCTERQYADAFCATGNMKFNTPQYWIDLEKSEGKGRGDLLEGMYLMTNMLDVKTILENKNIRKNAKSEIIDSNIYFRSDDTVDLPCYCLFSLYNTHFSEESIDKKGNKHHYYKVKKQYFHDFSDNNTKESIKNLPEGKRPALVMILDPTEFFERVRTYFEKLGVKREEILLNPVEYLNKKEPFVSTKKFPGELFLKDNSFSYQNEVRIVINTSNNNVLQELKKNNYIVNIGSLEDIASVEDFYYDDMILDLRGRTLSYKLPEPVKFNSLEELSKDDLLGLVYSYNNGSLNIKGDKETVLQMIKDKLRIKYNIYDIDYELNYLGVPDEKIK